MSEPGDKDTNPHGVDRCTDTYIDKQLYETGAGKRLAVVDLVIGGQYFARFADTVEPGSGLVEYTEYSVVLREIIDEGDKKRVVYTYVFGDEDQQSVPIDDTGLIFGRSEYEGRHLTKEGYFVGDEPWDQLLRVSETQTLELV